MWRHFRERSEVEDCLVRNTGSSDVSRDSVEKVHSGAIGGPDLRDLGKRTGCGCALAWAMVTWLALDAVHAFPSACSCVAARAVYSRLIGHWDLTSSWWAGFLHASCSASSLLHGGSGTKSSPAKIQEIIKLLQKCDNQFLSNVTIYMCIWYILVKNLHIR